MAKKTDSELIDALGGTTAVALLCGVKPPSVSDWRHSGIPLPRRLYLHTKRPDVVDFPVRASTPAKRQKAA